MKNKKIFLYKTLLFILIIFAITVSILIAKKYIGNAINEEKNIEIKIHYIVTEELLKKELITEDELLVLIENL